MELLDPQQLRVLRTLILEVQMATKEWRDLIRIVQSVLDIFLSPHCRNVCPITAFISRDPTPSVLTFFWISTATPVTVTQSQRELKINVDELLSCVPNSARTCCLLRPTIGSSCEKPPPKVSYPALKKVTMSL